MLVLDTPYGPAHAHLYEADDRRGVLVLGHGAGGGIGAKDLVGAKDVALAAGLGVALVEQPYRVAGRRSPPPAPHLDTCWLAVVEALRAAGSTSCPSSSGPVVGREGRMSHRSPDPRRGVLCLAFPLRRHKESDRSPPSRLPRARQRGAEVLSSRARTTASGCLPRLRAARSASSRATTACAAAWPTPPRRGGVAAAGRCPSL